MNGQYITLSAYSILISLLAANVIGILGGMWLMLKYVKAKGLKSKAQMELQKLADWLTLHRPDVIQEGSVVNIVINILSGKPKDTWRMD